MQAQLKLTGLECRGYPGQPGRFITGTCRGAAAGQQQGCPTLTASFHRAPARAGAAKACPADTGSTGRMPTKVSVGVQNLAVGADLVAALLGAAETSTAAAASDSKEGGRFEGTDGGVGRVSGMQARVGRDVGEGSSSLQSEEAAGICRVDGETGAAVDGVELEALLQNLSLLSIVESSSSSSSPLHCQALLSLSRLQCCWPPPTSSLPCPSTTTTNTTTSTASSNPPTDTNPDFSSAHNAAPPAASTATSTARHDMFDTPAADILQMEGLMACVADQMGGQHLSPVLLVPCIQVLQLQPNKQSAQAAVNSAAASLPAAGSGAAQHRTAEGGGNEVRGSTAVPLLNLGVHVPGIHVSLGSPSQAQVVGSVLARLQQQAHARPQQTSSPGSSTASQFNHHSAANTLHNNSSSRSRGAPDCASSKSASDKAAHKQAPLHLPPPPQMRAQLQLGILEVLAPACPTTAFGQMVYLAWREVAVHCVSSNDGAHASQGCAPALNSSSGSSNQAAPSVTASLQWQQLSVNLADKRTGQVEQTGLKQQQQEYSSEQQAQRNPHTSSSSLSSDEADMAVVHGPSLNVMGTLSAQHLRSLQDVHTTRRLLPLQQQQQQRQLRSLPPATTPLSPFQAGKGVAYTSASNPISVQLPPNSTWNPSLRRRTRRRADSSQNRAGRDAGIGRSPLLHAQVIEGNIVLLSTKCSISSCC
jgi:hypothetical protein